MKFKYGGGLWLALALATFATAQAQQSNDALLQQLQRSGAGSQTPQITNAPGAAGAGGVTVIQEAPAAAAPPDTRPALPAGRLEFEDFIARSLGRSLPLYGHNLFDAPSTFAPLDQVAVPADYVVGPGDEITIRAWGQIDIDYRAIVDRDGRIHIPKVGAVIVSGLAYQDLDSLIRRAVGRIYKNFELNVTLGQLRSIQIFVVGQARRPGSYVVSSLSTLVNALFASGGPSAKGSMRSIQLKRGNKLVTEFDLYDLLLKGDKSRDARLLPGDVIFIPPVGKLAAVAGSVNVPGIYELRGGSNQGAGNQGAAGQGATTLGELLAMAGGLSATAAGQKVTLERIAARMTRQVEEFDLDINGVSRPLQDGDLVNVYALSPRIQNAVTLRGNVAETQRFPWRSGLRIKDIIPERDALVIPNYWLQKNRLGQSESWIRGTREERLTQDVIRNEVVRNSAEINWEYAVVERLNFDDLTTSLIPFHLGRAVMEGDLEHNLALQPGDIVTIFSKDDIRQPLERQTKYVRLEGEFATAGVYQVQPGETLRQLVMRVGGFSANAYLYGAEFTRESTRIRQQQRLNDALDRMEEEVQRAAASRSASLVDPRDAEALQIEAMSQQRLLARLRTVKATGRIVLELPAKGAAAKDIPDLALEDGDRLYIPPMPSTVSVFGSVYNQNAYIYRSDKRLGDYLAQAGGPTKDADKGSVYLVKADGSVISKRQGGTFFNGFDGTRVMPGDTIVVPEDFDKFRWTRELKDWSQIFYQFALGVAGLKVLSDL